MLFPILITFYVYQFYTRKQDFWPILILHRSTIFRYAYAVSQFGFGFDTPLFVKVPRPGNSEETFSVFESVATCYYQSITTQKVEVIPLSALSKDTISELAGLFSH